MVGLYVRSFVRKTYTQYMFKYLATIYGEIKMCKIYADEDKKNTNQPNKKYYTPYKPAK